MKKQKEFTQNNECKVAIFIAELKCYIVVDASNVDTPEKKEAYIAKYVNCVNGCRDRNRD